MKIVVLVITVLLGLVVFFWWRTGGSPLPESLFVVRFDPDAITVIAPDGESRSVMWKDLTKVGIRTTDDGPAEPDVFWGLYSGAATADVVFPGGSTGEQEILAAMQTRLPGFDDRQVMEAMSTTSNAYFVIWEKRD